MSGTASTGVDFFLPGAFFVARDKRASSESLPSTAKRPGGAPGESSGVEPLLLFSKSFLASRLFSFSFSLVFSESLSFSLGAGSWAAGVLFSLPPLPPTPRPVSWALEGKIGKSGEEEEEVFDKGGGFPVVPLLFSGIPCEATLMDTLEKVLKAAGVKALVASGLVETPGREPGLLLGTEPASAVMSEEPFPTGIWLLRLVMECDGDLGWPRRALATSRLRRLEVLRELEEVWWGESEPGLLPEDDCSVTDSKIREWASLGVKRGARSSGLRFWTGASKRDEEWCWWCPWG